MMIRPVMGWMRCVGVLLLAGWCAVAGGYSNPALGIRNIGDPGVLEHGGVYYLYPTSNAPYSAKPDWGIRVWSSGDLVNWQPRGWALLAEPGDWGQVEFLGGEVRFRQGRFVMVYSARSTAGGTSRICAAVADSPLGPFRETTAPLLVTPHEELDANLFTDYDGRSYLYWSSIESGDIRVRGREIAADLSGFVGPGAVTILGPPYSAWEVNSGGFSVVEAPQMHRTRSGYTLTYSGDAYFSPGYAVGVATGASPLGTFTRAVGNPVLQKNDGTTPPISGPGSHHLVWSPDGTESFFLYNAHTDAATPNGDRSIYLDRVVLREDGGVETGGATNTPQADPSRDALPEAAEAMVAEDFTTATLEPLGSPGGWSGFGMTGLGLASVDLDTTAGTMFLGVAADATRFRIAGVQANLTEWLPYAAVGPERFVRARYYVYHGGQANPADGNEVPNFRARIANRFAVSSMLEVFHHLAGDPGNASLAAELRPSADPAKPSVYGVDLDPVDVPYLAEHGDTEGIMRIFETYALEPQENGHLALTESHLSVYPAIPWPPVTESSFMPKVYQTSAAGAGNLGTVNAAVEVSLRSLVPPAGEGEFAVEHPGAPQPVHSQSAAGVTLDTTAVPAGRIGIASRDFYPGGEPGVPTHVRVEEGRLYAVRFHLTSTQQSNLNAQVRMRARTGKFAWSQKFEIGGAWAAGAANNAIAQQALPGVGSQNPDRDGEENGGWYTLLMHSPLDVGIRPEHPPGTPLAGRMPVFAAQPGLTIAVPSRRDLLVGLDIVDSLSSGANGHLEAGHVTVDRIEVRSVPQVAD